LRLRQNALRLAQAISENPKISATAIILFMAAHWQPGNEQAWSRYVRHVLSKPIRRNDLLNAVAQCLRVRSPGPMLVSEEKRAVERSRTLIGAHILLAEDNPVNVAVAQGYLEEFGCTCDVAGTGAEAVEAYASGKQGYPIILMDCQMPEMDGITATRRIRAIETAEERPRIPIIAVTANAYAEDRAACAGAGMDDYLAKPYTEAQLLDVIRKWLPPNPQTGAEVAAGSVAA
jgi:two-component system, sensor histidine kinase and response regulator